MEWNEPMIGSLSVVFMGAYLVILIMLGWEDWKLEITATVRKVLLSRPPTSSASANHHGGLQRPNARQKVHKEPPSKITYRRLSHVA